MLISVFRWGHRILPAILFLAGAAAPWSAIAGAADAVLVAHYMPWYASREFSGSWGWHWTMGHFNPDQIGENGRPAVASHDVPLIGPYDSGDPDLLAYHVQLMKLAGIQGVVVDWYGIHDCNDYAMIHRNTVSLIPFLKRAGLKFAICYEDQAIGNMVKSGKLAPGEAVSRAKETLQWLEQNWFRDESYLRLAGRPLFLTFGPQYFNGDQWQDILQGIKDRPAFFALPHCVADSGADGAFGWPPVDGGKKVDAYQWRNDLDLLYGGTIGKESAIAVAFPGFHDIYKEAGLHDSYGRIEDDQGRTFSETLDRALGSASPVVQIATWNDFGEGTVVEPGAEHGYHYLEILQSRARLRSNNPLRFAPGDLRGPARLYRLRKELGQVPEVRAALDRAADMLYDGRCDEAATVLDGIEGKFATVHAAAIAPAVSEDPIYRFASNLPYRDGNGLDEYMKSRCRLDVYYPDAKGKYPTVVWFHGGGLKMGSRETPEALKKKGIIVVAVNYRLSPKVTSPAYIDDAAAAVAWTFKNIEQYGGSPDAIFVSGHSAGGYLAMMVGLDKRWLGAYEIDCDRLAGLIPFSGHTITHMTIREERGISDKQPIVDEMAPLFHVRKNTPPMLLITGDRDKEMLGRYEENAYFWRMMKVCGNGNVELREEDGYTHGGMPEPAFPLLIEFVRKHQTRLQDK